MENFSLDVVARKSVRGIFALVTRTFLLQILSVVASFILTIALEPDIFGIFFVVSSLVVFLNYFQDIGLAASLIQKKEEPTVADLRTTFTVQQVLVLTLVGSGFAFSGKIAEFYKLDQSGLFLLYALLFSFSLSSLRTIPTIIMERKLDFNKLVLPQIIENVIYNVVLIVGALSGMGINSFTWAILLRSVTGLIATYAVQSWRFGIAFDIASLKKLVSFGIPFQANSLLALAKDDLLNLYIGRVLPFQAVGYIGFSQKWAFLPLRLVMDNVIKITFPSMSRLQHDKAALNLAIEKSLFLVSFLIFPTAVGLILLSPSFIEFVPRYQKWEPALVLLTFFALNTLFSSISTPLTNFLNAIGKVKITLYFMIFWTAATWISTIWAINAYGYIGVAVASFMVSVSSVFVILIAKRYAQFSLFRPIFRQLIGAFLMGAFILATRELVTNLYLLLGEIFAAGLLYLTFFTLVAKDELKRTIRFIMVSVR